MPALHIASETFSRNNLEIAMLIVDSKLEWDGSCWKGEPYYDEFSKFLSKLTFTLAGDKEIYASFVERRGGFLLRRDLRKNKLRFISNGFFERRIAIQLDRDVDILKVIDLHERPFEWLFFHIGHLEKPSSMDDYQPNYLSKEEKNFDWRVFSKAHTVVYHECEVAYAEIFSIQNKSKDMISTVQNIYALGRKDWPNWELVITT